MCTSGNFCGCCGVNDFPQLSVRIISQGVLSNIPAEVPCIEPIIHSTSGHALWIQPISIFRCFITSCVHLLTKFNLHKFPLARICPCIISYIKTFSLYYYIFFSPNKDLTPSSSLPLAVPSHPSFPFLRPSFAIRTLRMMFFGKARTLFHHFPPHWNSQLNSGRSCMNNSRDNINPCRMSIETFFL
jgi:hypothetical protein